MSRRSCVSFMLIGTLVCSAALALQPTVRAGSISLNSGVKPTPNTVTSTTGSSSATSTVSTTDRGATIGKFTMPKAVPVGTGNSNNNSVSSAVLDELQRQIDELRRDQDALANSQLKASDVEDTIETQVKSLDLTTTNRDLKEALSEIRSTNQELQTSVNSIQQQTNQISDTFTNRVDDRLKVVGVIDTGNNLAFVKKSDVTPQAIANQIVADPTATATLTNKIQKSDNDIKNLVDSTLIDRELLNQDKSVKVATTDQIPTINETTVINALQNNNGTTFKQMVDTAVREKYMSGDTSATLVTTKNIANQMPDDVVRTSGGKIAEGVLPTNVVKADSEGRIAESVLPTNVIKADSKGKIDERSLPENVVTTTNTNGFAKTSDIVDSSNKLKIALPDNVVTLNSNNEIDEGKIPTTIARASAVTSNTNELNTLKGKVLDKDGNPIASGVNETQVSGIILETLRDKEILDESNNLKISTGDGLTESRVGEIVDGKMTNVITKGNLSENKIVTLNSNNEIDEGKIPTTIARADAVTSNTNELNTLKGKVLDKDGNPIAGGVNESRVSGIVLETLRNKEILDESNNLKISTGDGLTESQVNNIVDGKMTGVITTSNLAENKIVTLNSNNEIDDTKIPTTIARADAVTSNTNELNTLKGKVLDKDGNPIAGGVNESRVSGIVLETLRNKEILDESNNLKISTGDGLTESQVNNIVDGKMTGVITTSNLAENNIVTYKDGMIDDNDLSTNIVRASALSNYAPTSALSEYAKTSALSGLASESYVDTKLASMTTGFEFKGACGWTSAQTTCSSDKNSHACTFNNKLYICGCDGSNCTYSTLDMGSDGASFNFMGSCGSSAPTVCNDTQRGNACTFGNSLYICSCTGNTCSYIGTQIVPDPVELTYCKENISKVSQLYSDITDVSKCDLFTSERYAAVIGGARTYCLSIMQGTIDINSDIGKRLARTFTSDKISEFANATLAQRKTMKGFKKSSSDLNATFLDACEARYNEIMAADTAWHAYCISDNNLTNYIKPLFGDDKTCDNFSESDYTAMLGGADAYCIYTLKNKYSIATDDLNARFKRAFGVSSFDLTSVTKDSTFSIKKANGQTESMTFLQACKAKYNEIMAAETAWHAYCMADDNLTNYIQPLFGDSKTCDNFSESDYTAMLGGARAYCIYTLQNKATIASDELNARFKRAFGVSSFDLTKIDKNSTFTITKADGTTQSMKFLSACEAKYNEIMAGQNADTAWHAYCIKDNNLTNIIKPLFGDDKTCDNFSESDYTAMLGGAKAYCVYTLQNKTTVATADLNAKFKRAFGVSSFDLASVTKDSTFTITKADGTTQSMKFLSACEAKYNEIMAGQNADTAWHAYCIKDSNLANVIKPLFGDSKTCDNFSESDYTAMLGGAKAYCVYTLQNKTTVATADLNAKFKRAFGVSSFDLASVTKDSTFTITKADGTTQSMKFLTACETKYNEIMAGADGAPGSNGNDGITFYPSYENGRLVVRRGSQTGDVIIDQTIKGQDAAPTKIFSPVITADGTIAFVESSEATPASLNLVTALKANITGTSANANGASYASANDLTSLIKAIATDVAKDVSTKVSAKVSRQVATNVSDSVAKTRINSIKDKIVTPDSLTLNSNGTVTLGSAQLQTLNQSNDATMCAKDMNGHCITASNGSILGSSSDLISSTASTPSVALSTAFAGISGLSNVTSESDLDISTSSYFGGSTTTTTCSTSQYKLGNTCLSCGSGASSAGGSATTCSCSGNKKWVAGTTGGSCVEDKTTCLNGSNTYWDPSSSTCKSVPANATRSSDGETFSCNTNYYKTSTGCVACGGGSTSSGGNLTTCDCGTNSTWNSSSNTCTQTSAQEQASCVADTTKYWNGSSCVSLPANSTQASGGTSFSCNKNYYKSGNSCLTCGSNATSNAGSTSCTCTSTGYEWSSTSSGGTCTQTCAQVINNTCVNNETECNKIGGYTWNGKTCVKGTTTTCTKPQVYVGEKFGTCKACESFGLGYIESTGSCCPEEQYLFLGGSTPQCRQCETGYDRQTGTCACDEGKTFDATTGQCSGK